MSAALVAVALLAVRAADQSPLLVRPPETLVWSSLGPGQLARHAGSAAASTLGLAARAAALDQALAFDPNLPAELQHALPAEIADSTPGFVVGEFHHEERHYGPAPGPPPVAVGPPGVTGGPPAAAPPPPAHVAGAVRQLQNDLRLVGHNEVAAVPVAKSFSHRQEGRFYKRRPGPQPLPPGCPFSHGVHVGGPSGPAGAVRPYGDGPASALDLRSAPPPGLVAEVDLLMPRPPLYLPGPPFGPPNGTVPGGLGRELAGPLGRTDCALPLKDRDCITYEAIEAAFQETLNYVPIDFPRGEWLPQNVATVGDALLKTSLSLAARYKLSPYEIEHLLPRADTLQTSIAKLCPDFVHPIQCHPKRYRRIDGLCNNIHFPNWGATRRIFQRLVEPHYADSMDQPRPGPLPNARLVSASVHVDRDLFDHASTLMLIAWGQFMDHDFTLTFTRPDERTRNEPEDCCNQLGPEDCLPIRVRRDDPFYSRYGIDCIDFVRARPGVRQFCRLGSRSGFNVLTGVIDANTVYGQTDEAASTLRMFEGGKLKSFLPEHFKPYGMLPLLPLRYEHHDEGCIRDHPGQHCFLAGEIRVNEQLILSTMHLTWFREHNRICSILKQLNPHWDDEKLYQETRRIVIACIQHITFNEFLPMLLGKTVMKQHDLVLTDHGYWNGYNEYEDPSITLAFMTSAYRFGHSLLPTVVERWSPTHKYINERDLSDLIRRPYDLYQPGAVDEYILGQINQPAMAMDFAITEEVTNRLFKKPTHEHGMDLVALNLQRAREMGVPSYMHYRKWCGLPTTSSWHEFSQFVSNDTTLKYSQLYKSTWDVDLFTGGISEKPLPHSMVGPTFACIIGAQLHRIRHGDRFWYELGNQPSSFTPDQLQQIRRVHLSKVLCDNTDIIKTIQVYPLVLPDYDANPRVPCHSGVLPSIDLSYWQEILH